MKRVSLQTVTQMRFINTRSATFLSYYLYEANAECWPNRPIDQRQHKFETRKQTFFFQLFIISTDKQFVISTTHARTYARAQTNKADDFARAQHREAGQEFLKNCTR